MWLAVIIGFLLLVLLINGMVHQERFILWKEYQGEVAEQKKAHMDERKKTATGRIKEMLRETRKRTAEETAAALAATAEESAVEPQDPQQVKPEPATSRQ